MREESGETLIIFEQFESHTVITATLEMQTVLSIGSRSSLEPTGTDMPVIKDPRGIPFIPGSSIKGVVRSQMERVLRALGETDVALKACDPLDNLCVSSEAKEALIRELRLRKEKEPERVLSQKIWDASCTICRLFGSPWLASRLSFEDARLINIQDLMEVTQIRDGVGIDRDRGAAKEGIKYDFEVVSPEAKFGISILAENVQTWEIGMLLAILRPWQEGLISIGGKSTRGPGWGKLSNIIIKRVEKEHLLDYLLRGEMAQISEGDLIKDFETRLPLGGINHA